MEGDFLPIVTRREARSRELLRYFTGKPCVAGHTSERSVSNGACLFCCREKQAARRARPELKEGMASIKRASRAKNARKAREYAKRYRDERKGEHSERFRRWHESASQSAEYRARKAAATKAWVESNPERARLADSIKRARKRVAKPLDFGDFDRFVIEEAFAACRRRRAMTGIEWHVDHMIPLSRGGAHAWNNVQVIPAEVNLKKRNRLIYTEPCQWLDFYER